jgi:hypothetical protein
MGSMTGRSGSGIPWIVLTGWVFLAAVVGLVGCRGERGARREFLSIGTAGTGGVYYPLGGALASLLSVDDTLRQFTAEVTGGSVENVNRLREGQIDLGFCLAVSIYEAFHGGGGQAPPFEGLRVVAPLYPNLVHILVRRSSRAASLADLVGARISVGSAGSGTEQVARQVFEAYGLGYEDVQIRYLSFAESAAALMDGAIDAAIISVGHPAAAVLEATTTGGARLLPMDEASVARLRERYPYYSPGRIPAGAYPGVAEDVTTVAMMNWIVAREDLDGDVVARLLSILRDRRDDLARVHHEAGQIDLEMLRDPPIPLHPAAAAWLDGR